MPLQRDLPRVHNSIEQQNSMAKKLEDYTGRRQRERDVTRPQTPPGNDHNKSQTQNGNFPPRVNRDDALSAVFSSQPANHFQKNLNGSKAQDVDLHKIAASFKLPVSKVLPPQRSVQNTKPGDQNSHTSSEPQTRSLPSTHPVTMEHTSKSAFDDTEILEISELDEYSRFDDLENETRIFRPLPLYRQHVDKPTDILDGGSYRTDPIKAQVEVQVSQEIQEILNSNGHAEPEEEGQQVGNPHLYTARQSLHHGRKTSFDAAVLQHRSTKMVAELDRDPDTPSRTASVPPRSFRVSKVNGNKAVAFVDSPSFRSADFAREESPELLGPRTVKEQMKVHSLPLHPKAAPGQSEVNTSGVRKHHAESHSVLVPNRFQRVKGFADQGSQQEDTLNHQTSSIHEGPNSSDEDLNTHPNRSIQLDPLSRSIPGSQKRPRDELDYDTENLKKKTLQELQNEPFCQNPRADNNAAPVDAHGNAMTLDQILTNLNKMNASQQEAVFRGQSDEEWSKTGTWFVEKFQADLKKLTDIRLQRRKVALKFEDAIRRRQAEVEQHAAGVDKDLATLQQGGQELVKDRKPASRCATPMKSTGS